LGFVEAGLGLLLEAVELLANGTAVFGGHRFELVEEVGQAAFAAQVEKAKLVEGGGGAYVSGGHLSGQAQNRILHDTYKGTAGSKPVENR
jgi:hypothetical protein